MKIEGKRIRSLKFLEKVEELTKKEVGVILDQNQVPNELKRRGTGKFRPDINWGKNSKRNTVGEYITNKDLPKKNKYINTIEWHWRQYHGKDLEDIYEFVDVYRNVYQKDFVKPMEVDFIYVEEKNLIYADLELDLLKNYNKILVAVNILLEKFGFCQILDDDYEEYIPKKGFEICNWEILPEGEEIWDVLGNKKYSPPKEGEKRKRASFEAYRITTFINKKQKKKYVGINGFQDYLVFVFDKICILETNKYGNATYIVKKENWKTASMFTKAELLNSDFIVDRIIHNEDWKNKIDKIL